MIALRQIVPSIQMNLIFVIAVGGIIGEIIGLAISWTSEWSFIMAIGGSILGGLLFLIISQTKQSD